MDPQPTSLRIRLAGVEDAAAIAGIYRPFVEESAVSFETEAPAPEEMTERIENAISWVVAEADGEVVGYAYAAPFHRRAAYRWSVEVSVYLAPQARGRGLGRALITDLLDRLGEMGYVNAFAGTTLPNEASTRLFESLGFERMATQTKVGFKLGAWHDVGWWQKQLREPAVPPAEPSGLPTPPTIQR